MSGVYPPGSDVPEYYEISNSRNYLDSHGLTCNRIQSAEVYRVDIQTYRLIIHYNDGFTESLAVSINPEEYYQVTPGYSD